MDTILDYLDRLRAKPIHVRKRIAFVTTVALSFLIASVWWNSWNVDSAPSAKELTASAASPWSVVSDTFANAKESVLAAFSDATNELKKSGLEYAREGEDENVGNAETVGADAFSVENETSNPSLGEAAPAADPHEVLIEEAIHSRPKTAESVAAKGAVE